MLFHFVLPLQLSLTAAQIYPGLNDYGLLRSHVWKYPHHHHQPPALFYKGSPISENAYGYYPPLWNVHAPRPYVPNRKPPKPDYEKDLQKQEGTKDIRGQGRFCQFFDDSAGKHKQHTGSLRSRSFFPEYEGTSRGESSNEEVDTRRYHVDPHIRSADEDDEDFRIGRVKKGKDISMGNRQEGIQSSPFRPQISEDDQ